MFATVQGLGAPGAPKPTLSDQELKEMSRPRRDVHGEAGSQARRLRMVHAGGGALRARCRSS